MREKIHKQRVLTKHTSTNLMMVDSLTKGLSPKIFIEDVMNMIIIDKNDC